jgi:hypothetical protein
MMLADTGSSAELDHLLGRLEPDDDNTRRFVEWARNYAAGRRAHWPGRNLGDDLVTRYPGRPTPTDSHQQHSQRR